mmetsp:Transcript_34048/g.90719  ORF Transcript_34048/g.90719 Transcript_34048/m.90719 type:complete len:236 (+) Transcript_34048:299-1006(+)
MVRRLVFNIFRLGTPVTQEGIDAQPFEQLDDQEAQTRDATSAFRVLDQEERDPRRRPEHDAPDQDHHQTLARGVVHVAGLQTVQVQLIFDGVELSDVFRVSRELEQEEIHLEPAATGKRCNPRQVFDGQLPHDVQRKGIEDAQQQRCLCSGDCDCYKEAKARMIPTCQKHHRQEGTEIHCEERHRVVQAESESATTKEELHQVEEVLGNEISGHTNAAGEFSYVLQALWSKKSAA